MKKIRYLLNWYDTNGGGASFLKYEAGRDYDLNDESERHVLQGHAAYIEVPDQDPVAAPATDPATAGQPPAGTPVPVTGEQLPAAPQAPVTGEQPPAGTPDPAAA